MRTAIDPRWKGGGKQNTVKWTVAYPGWHLRLGGVVASELWPRRSRIKSDRAKLDLDRAKLDLEEEQVKKVLEALEALAALPGT
jgi:hypothetical protein